MPAQFSKLTVICNVCFWFAFGFRYIKAANAMPSELVSTLVVLGAMALMVNGLWFVLRLFGRPVAITRPWVVFIALSCMFQIYSLLVFLL
jgi:hypothetical protein